MNLRQLLSSWLRPKARKSCSHTKRRAHSARPQLECLEDRMVPTVVYGVLFIDGDQLANHNDTVSLDVVNNGVQATLNGQTSQYAAGAISAVVVNTGDGTDTVNVLRTVVPVYLNYNGGGGTDVANIGAFGNVQGIKAPVTISNGPSYTHVLIDDSADYNPNIYHSNVALSYSSLTGLSPAPINFGSASVNTLTINGGTTNNSYFIDSPQGYLGVTLNTGNGDDDLTVKSTTNPLTVNGGRTRQGVVHQLLRLGSNHSLAGLNGTVTINNAPSYFRVEADDSEDSANHPNVALSAGSLTGLSPAAIYFGSASVSTMRIGCGRGNNTYNIDSPQGYLGDSLDSGNGDDTVNVKGTYYPLTINGGGSGNDVVNLGFNNSLASLNGALTINNVPSYFHVNVNDSADSANHSNVVLSAGSLTGLSPAAVYFGSFSVNTLTLNGGSGNNAYTINNPQGYLGATLNTGDGNDTVNVQGTVYALTLNGGSSGNNTLSGPAASSDWQITGLNAGRLTASSITTFTAFQNLSGGAGNDTFYFDNGGGVDGTIDGGGGTNALNYLNYNGNVVVNLQLGTATGVGGGITGASIQNVTGGSGAGGYNILVGNGGNVLNGGNGRRSLLIAGGSASTLVASSFAGTDESILIAGTTDYDANAAALLDILSVWTGADTYANRVAGLVDDPAYAFSLNAATVHSNGGGNTLQGKPLGGATPLDLYFANLAAGDTTDATALDRVVGIS